MEIVEFSQGTQHTEINVFYDWKRSNASKNGQKWMRGKMTKGWTMHVHTENKRTNIFNMPKKEQINLWLQTKSDRSDLTRFMRYYGRRLEQVALLGSLIFPTMRLQTNVNYEYECVQQTYSDAFIHIIAFAWPFVK